MKFSDKDKYKYSIVDICGCLHGDVTGSSDPLTKKRFNEYYEWLKWRVKDGWQASRDHYDFSIYMMAMATIDMVAKRANHG